MQVPPELETFTEDINDIADRDQSIWWKIKAQASLTTYRLFSKYAVTKFVKNDKEALAFNETFLAQYGELLLESHLQLVFKKKTNFVGSRTLNFNLKLIQQSIKIPQLKDKLIPFVDTILYEIVIPLLLMSNKDIQQFDEDPVEFIRSLFDFLESIFMPKNTTIELLVGICNIKQQKGKKVKPDYLVPFLSFATNNMNQYNEQVKAGANPDWRIKEALLYAIGSLSETIKNHDDISANIEPMLKEHVLPFLQCDNTYLRHRACWVYGEFCDYTFDDSNHVAQAVDGIY